MLFDNLLKNSKSKKASLSVANNPSRRKELREMRTNRANGDESQQLVRQAYSSTYNTPQKLSRLQKICVNNNSKLLFEQPYMKMFVLTREKSFYELDRKAYLFSFIIKKTLHIQHGFWLKRRSAILLHMVASRHYLFR